MDFLTCLTCIALGTSFMIACEQQLELSRFKVGVPSSQINSQSKGALDSKKANVSITVNLLPYEILDRQATSYGDISLTLSNSSEKEIEVEVIRLEIVAASAGRVLMSSTPQVLNLPAKISLRSGETRTVEYRLQSASKLYQKGQDAFARIRYRHTDQSERVIQSNPEAVAFMIP
jgi:hypothetical protein